MQRLPTDARDRRGGGAWCGSRTGASIRRRTRRRISIATPIILNSFTKSYIIDRAVARGARRPDRRARCVVNIGGDLVARGAWTETVGVTDPLDNADNAAPLTRLAVRDRAVATSGSYRRGFDIGGGTTRTSSIRAPAGRRRR